MHTKTYKLHYKLHCKVDSFRILPNIKSESNKLNLLVCEFKRNLVLWLQVTCMYVKICKDKLAPDCKSGGCWFDSHAKLNCANQHILIFIFIQAVDIVYWRSSPTYINGIDGEVTIISIIYKPLWSTSMLRKVASKVRRAIIIWLCNSLIADDSTKPTLCRKVRRRVRDTAAVYWTNCLSRELPHNFR